MRITFTIPGLPVPQARSRHRVAKLGDGRALVTQYDPKESREWKAVVRQWAALARAEYGLGQTLLEDPLELEAVFIFPPPKSTRKRILDDIAHGALIPKVTKPDLKNLLAGVEDAMTGILYRDDSLIFSYGVCCKVYGSVAETRITLYTRPVFNPNDL